MSNKPSFQKDVCVSGSNVGAIMLDKNGYFYRPKCGKGISSVSHNQARDSRHFPDFESCLFSVLYGED